MFWSISELHFQFCEQFFTPTYFYKACSWYFCYIFSAHMNISVYGRFNLFLESLVHCRISYHPVFESRKLRLSDGIWEQLYDPYSWVVWSFTFSESCYHVWYWNYYRNKVALMLIFFSLHINNIFVSLWQKWGKWDIGTAVWQRQSLIIVADNGQGCYFMSFEGTTHDKVNHIWNGDPINCPIETFWKS